MWTQCIYGKVWGFVFDSFNQLRIIDSDVTGFNYRGIATVCTGLHGKPLNGVVQSNNSNYYGNKGAGLWIQYAELLLIDGGESYKNGFLGQTGTGYGVTASLAVNRVECRAHNFHKNYRKGLDTHGCHDVLVKGCTFTDNVLYHMALLQWGRTGSNTYFAQEENILIDGNVFSKGSTKVGRDFLDAAYAANAANGFTMRINDLNIDGYNAQNTDPTTTLKEVVISNNNFMGNYYPASFCADTTPFRFAIPASAVVLKGNIIKAKNHVAANFNSMYCASVMFAECKSLKIDSNNIDAVGSNFNYSTQYFGTLVLTQNEQAMDFQLHNNVINLPKMWFLSGYSGTGALYPAIHKIGQTGKFITKSNQINIAGIPTPDIASYAVLGRLFDSTYPEHYQLNNTIRVGSKMLPQLIKKVDMTESMQPWRTNSAVGLVAAGKEILEIIIDAIAIWNIDLYFAIQNETVRVQQFAYTFPAGVTSTSSANFAFSRAEEFTDIDGIKKRRIVIKTLKDVTVNTYFFGTARMSGALGSYGIHEVNYLA